MADKVITPITTEEAMNYLQKEKVKILEDFAKAYLAETGLNPSEIELVSEQEALGTRIETVYYFRRKK